MFDLFLKNAQVYDGDFRPANLLIQSGKITAVGTDVRNTAAVPELDAHGCRAVPGFIDVHTHGAVGVDVNAADPAGLAKIGRFFASQGTTRWLASILTDTPEQTLAAIGAVKQAMTFTGGARLLGIHLEGPFLSPDYKGAMPPALLQKGNVTELEKYRAAAGEALRYITMAPEVEGVPACIDALRGSGVRVALGHSGATYAQTQDCLARGAVAFTHTANGMRLFHQHEPAIFGAALESDGWCEAICDGRHLHPGTVCMLLKCKGENRVLAITDSIMAAGLPDGRYRLGVNDVVVKDGDAMLADGSSRAGSTLTMQKALQNLLAFTGRPMEKLLPLMAQNQAEMLGLQGRYGALRRGCAGDVVLLDEKANVLVTVAGGEIVWEKN